MASILDIVKSRPSSRPAIGGMGRRTLSYGELAALALQTVREINDIGIGRGDRVAVVLPNGPELATVFLSVAAGASVAPLNSTYRADEFARYLSDLAVKAVVVDKNHPSAAVSVAEQLMIPILEIECDRNKPAGWFRLNRVRRLHSSQICAGASASEDEALALHTSGTTSRPKVVPLRNGHLTHSARNVSAVLQLGPDDVGLNIMPLFHIHGLVASLLASVQAGAQVVCAPAFDALKFYRWLREADPSWYTAVPTMHKAILARAPHNESVVRRSHLRFIRSSSAPMPPNVAAELEQVFRCPVIEAYGMTEASHQIASNPLPPKERRTGTVGVPAGPDVAIMNDQGTIVPQGHVGEVVIRGLNVFLGYDNNPEANAGAFVDGWFRTGDQGFIDPVGYLTILGRLKETITRGGEKIAPREIDDVLHAHPAVEQALAFPVPDPTLGEEVAAIIVLKDGTSVTEQDIREFVGARLAKFKVPRRILFRDDIPKSATGKLQRIGLAKKVGLF